MRRSQNYRPRHAAGGRGLDEAIHISVTRHSIQRYVTRGRRHATPHQIEREIAQSILAEVDLGALFKVKGTTHLAILRVDSRRLCAVLDVAGPIQKPFAITVCTVLTAEMAINSYGHLSGLIEAVDGFPRRNDFSVCHGMS